MRFKREKRRIACDGCKETTDDFKAVYLSGKGTKKHGARLAGLYCRECRKVQAWSQ